MATSEGSETAGATELPHPETFGMGSHINLVFPLPLVTSTQVPDKILHISINKGQRLLEILKLVKSLWPVPGCS